MGEAFAWGFIAASSLLLGGILALRRPIGLRPMGLIMAFGAGVLISAVSYCNRYRGAAINSNTSDSSTGSTDFRCVRDANNAQIEAVDSPTCRAQIKRPGTAP
jgi:hypothetical protein